MNNHRMDRIISSVRTLLKIESKGKRSGISPMTKNMGQKGIQKDKSNKKLIERV